MENNICNKCGKEMRDSKELCYDCLCNKDDRRKKNIGEVGRIVGVLVTAVAFLMTLKEISRDDNESK